MCLNFVLFACSTVIIDWEGGFGRSREGSPRGGYHGRDRSCGEFTEVAPPYHRLLYRELIRGGDLQDIGVDWMFYFWDNLRHPKEMARDFCVTKAHEAARLFNSREPEPCGERRNAYTMTALIIFS